MPGMPAACQDGVGELAPSLPVPGAPTCTPIGALDLCPWLGRSLPPQPRPEGAGGSPKPLSLLPGCTEPSSTKQPESPIPGSCQAGYRARTGSKHPCVPQDTPAALRPRSRNAGSGFKPMGASRDQPLPEVLLWSRNSICSLCPLFSARARGVGHWGSPVAQLTAAPQKSRACVSARSLVVTAAHRACGRAGRAAGEAEGSRGGGDPRRGATPAKGTGWERGEQPDPCRLPAAWAGQRRLELGEKVWSRQRIPPLRSRGEVIRQRGGTG